MIKRLVVLVGVLLAGVSMSWPATNTAAAPRSSNGLVINEVYAPNTTYSSQYFELYNEGTASIDLSSYVIYNSSGSNSLSVLPNPILTPGSYLAVGASAFPPTNTIGSGLSPTADFLGLVQHSGAQDSVIDVVNWGAPNPNWPNYQAFQAYFFSSPPTMPTDTNFSLQRYPDGRDTDQGSDWVALPRSPSHAPPTYTPTPTNTATATVTGSPVGVTATVTPTPFCQDSYEPDGTPGQATPLQLGTEQTDHTICPNNDEDWFIINVVANKVYTLYTKDLTGGLDTIMAVYTYPYDGTKIAENDDAPGCLCSRIDMSFTSNGNYYVRVRDNRQQGGSGWDYTVGFTATPGPAPSDTPTFTVTPNPNAPTATPTEGICLDAYEPDGVPAAANLFLIGEVQAGHTFCPNSDADWYKFFGGRGKAYTIATANLGIGVDTYMYLFDSDGHTVLAENDDIAGQAPSGDPNDVVSSSIQFFPIRDDFYYIMVKNKGDLGAPFMTYDISMKVQANVPPPAGSPTPIIAPIVTVTFPPTAAPPQPLPTDTAPAAAPTDTPMPLPTAVPTGQPPVPTDTPTPVSGAAGVIGTQPPAAESGPPSPPPEARTATPVLQEPGPGGLPTVAPIVPLPATGHTLDPAQMLSMPFVVYMDQNGNNHFSAGEGIYGLRLVFADEDGAQFASVMTDRQGAVRVRLPRSSTTTVMIPYLRWRGSVQANEVGLLVRLPKVVFPARIP